MAKKISIRLPLSAEECFERFCNVESLVRWVPYITKASLVSAHPRGRAAEVRFEALDSHDRQIEYTLLYAYDDERYRIAWQPGDGASDAVRGFAAFESDGPGCWMIYALNYGRGRIQGAEEDAAIVDAEATLAAFAAWLELADQG